RSAAEQRAETPRSSAALLWPILTSRSSSITSASFALAAASSGEPSSATRSSGSSTASVRVPIAPTVPQPALAANAAGRRACARLEPEQLPRRLAEHLVEVVALPARQASHVLKRFGE